MTKPKGTIDYFGVSAERLLRYTDICKDVFEQNGGQYLDTPVFENKSTLMQKYGDEAESKLIYEISNDDLVLRYDLTVPFMRFLKSNKITNVRRYSIGKVYRRDNPSVQQGRFREFYQADFDIVGERSSSGGSELLILGMVKQILDQMNITGYIFYVNFTQNLYSMIVEQLGVPKENFKSICSTIDKLDKQPWEFLEGEFMTKGLTLEQIKMLYTLLQTPLTCPKWGSQPMLELYGLDKCVVWSPSLARGLDYYDGMIFEVKLNGSTSISAGGQYSFGKSDVGIGFSIGITRIMTLVSPVPKVDWRQEYFATTVGNVSEYDRMKTIMLCKKCIVGNLPLTWSLSQDKKLGKVLAEKAKEQIRWVIVIAEEELKSGIVIVKDLSLNIQTPLKL